MRISSILGHALVIAYGSALALGLGRSIFGPHPASPSLPVARHADLALMDSVRSVNAAASLVMLSPYFSLAIDNPVPCLLAQGMREKSDLELPAVAQIVADQGRECEFTRFTRQLTRPVFDRVASAKALPIELFSFAAFHEDAWVDVGLFDQIGDCLSAQRAGLRLGIGVRACAPWRPGF